MYAVLCSDGLIDANAVLKECRVQKWAPIVAYRKNDTPDKAVIPVFDDPNTAQKFAKRNLPSEWLRGAVFLIPPNLEWIKNQGWEVERMTFPKLVKDLPLTLGFEILEFIEQPEVFIHR